VDKQVVTDNLPFLPSRVTWQNNDAMPQRLDLPCWVFDVSDPQYKFTLVHYQLTVVEKLDNKFQ
jgi:hypothetical protein